jgi:hypothetical protein
MEPNDAMDDTPLFAVPELEAEARAISAPRRAVILAFLRQCVETHCPDLDASVRDDETLRQTFRAIEPTLAVSDYLPLARQLEVSDETSFVDHAREVRLRRLHRTNVLRIPGHDPRVKAPPLDSTDVVDIFQRVRAILAASDDVTKWSRAFIQQQLFQTTRAAEQAAADFAKVPRFAASQACSLVQQWLQTDDSALLNHSTYPYTSALTLLYAQVQEAARQSDGALDSPAVLRDLCADVVCRGMRGADETAGAGLCFPCKQACIQLLDTVIPIWPALRVTVQMDVQVVDHLPRA